ncbi:GNAT family N-acetyltransferase [Streptococcus hongkongensis]|nr:GCN5 family acetyltransferase [Streptococcus uberis]
MNWCIKAFDQLTRDELFVILKERVAVFVVEQACAYPEIDDLDQHSVHVFKQDSSGQLLAYCRIIPTEEMMKLGRVLTTESARGKGLGHELVATALSYCQENSPHLPVYAQAQAHLQDFYDQFGFKATSEVYLEDNIPHIDMMKEND